MNTQAFDHRIIYGVPIADEEIFGEPSIASAEYCEVVPTSASYSENFAENDFDDVIEILAHVNEELLFGDNFCEVMASPVATAENVTTADPMHNHYNSLPVASAEAQMPFFSFIGVEAHPVDDFGSDSYEQKIIMADSPAEEFKYEGLESLNQSFIASLTEDPQKKKVRGEAAQRLRQKMRGGRGSAGRGERLREMRGGQLHIPLTPSLPQQTVYSAPNLVAQVPYPAPAPAPAPSYFSSSSPFPLSLSQPSKNSLEASRSNARQLATAKREREGGRFKRARTTWVSVTDLFKSHPPRPSS